MLLGVERHARLVGERTAGWPLCPVRASRACILVCVIRSVAFVLLLRGLRMSNACSSSWDVVATQLVRHFVVNRGGDLVRFSAL